MKNSRTDKLKIARGVINSTVNFNIVTDGSSVDVKAIFGNQAFNAKALRGVSEIKEKWVAALLHNKAIISRFRMPVKMSFE